MPEEPWTEVCNIVQEVANKIIPKKNKSKKAKWLSEEALQIVEEQKEVKSKGERERYIKLNTDFQRTAQRDKKAFFSEQCIELEDNNRRRKTRDLFRKVGDIKGAFCPKMSMIKDINYRDLVDAEEIKKRWKEYMEELYKKDPNELDYYDGVVSQPEPDILECEVGWALGNTAVNKASECDGIPGELFKTIKDDSIKVLHSICQQIWKSQQWS